MGKLKKIISAVLVVFTLSGAASVPSRAAENSRITADTVFVDTDMGGREVEVALRLTVGEGQRRFCSFCAKLEIDTRLEFVKFNVTNPLGSSSTSKLKENLHKLVGVWIDEPSDSAAEDFEYGRYVVRLPEEIKIGDVFTLDFTVDLQTEKNTLNSDLKPIPTDYIGGKIVVGEYLNRWTSELSVNDRTEGDAPLPPSASAEYGTPYFLYSDDPQGTFTPSVPEKAGVYYVKAVVDRGEHYGGMESEAVRFEIFPPIIPDVMRGDVNGDGQINTTDVILILRRLCGWEISAFDEKAADFDKNGQITVVDAILLLRLFADGK